jgi:NADP-dependent aldehyde dehydrogenase
MSSSHPILLEGAWRPARAQGSFHATDPLSGDALPDAYPISGREDVLQALAAGAAAAEALDDVPAAARAAFLEDYADRIEARRGAIAAAASSETALPASPRLEGVELPRTTGQLRQAAAAARERSWTQPTIDTATGIRSMLGPLGGPVVVFGPNNFPLAFNAVSGGDFAAAIATGHPVIAKGHPAHPTTTRLLAEAAFESLQGTGLPPATLQLLYHTRLEDGPLLVSDPRVAATAYTGSRASGLALKAAADAAGKPIYLEMSSVNPVFLLPGALAERGAEIAGELFGSATMAAGQFCTNPGVVVALAGAATEALAAELRERYAGAEPGPLLTPRGVESLSESVAALREAGAELLAGGEPVPGRACRFGNTLLRVGGSGFLEQPAALQREAFGNATLLVVAEDADQIAAIAASFEGNLTGSLYTSRDGSDDALYARLARPLRRRVGRLLNDKMPTGVAVSPAMQHGGPFPATGHPGFTSVGIPASLRRFAMLQSFDNVREPRLPPELRDRNPDAKLWRLIDGSWTTGDVPAPAGRG